MRAPSGDPGGTLIVCDSARICALARRRRRDSASAAAGRCRRNAGTASKHHVPARRFHRAGAWQWVHGAGGDVQLADPLAGRAVLLPRDGHCCRWPPRIASSELERHRLVQVDAAFRRPLRAPRPRAWCRTSANRSPNVDALVPLTLMVKSKPVEAERGAVAGIAEHAGGCSGAGRGFVAQRFRRASAILTELRRRHPVTGLMSDGIIRARRLVGPLDVGPASRPVRHPG